MKKDNQKVWYDLLKLLQLPLWTVLFLLWGIWKLSVIAGTLLGAWSISFQPAFSAYYEEDAPHLPYIWQVMSNFDGQHYLAIAAHGYQPLTQAFFPFYPLMISLLARSFHLPFIISGLIISGFSFLVALYVCYQLFIRDQKDVHKMLSKESVWILLLVILFFPTAAFYGATYNDAAFFLLASITLWLGRSQKWLLASGVGFLATLTRLNGLALWPFLVIEYLMVAVPAGEEWNLKWWWKNTMTLLPKLKDWQIWVTLLIPAAFGGYLLFHQIMFGSWHVVFANMQVWHQDRLTLPPQVIWRYVKIFATFDLDHYQYWIAVLEFLFVLFYLGCLYYGWRKLRFSYWVFIAVSIFIPWMTGTFQGMPRYGLHLYPLFLVVTLWLVSQPKWLKILYFVISISLFLFYTALFTRGYFVA